MGLKLSERSLQCLLKTVKLVRTSALLKESANLDTNISLLLSKVMPQQRPNLPKDKSTKGSFSRSNNMLVLRQYYQDYQYRQFFWAKKSQTKPLEM